MADDTDILLKLAAAQESHEHLIQTIRDIEDLLERLTRVQNSFRNDRTARGRMIKAELDHLVRLIISGASVVYAKELKGILRPR